MPFLNLCQNCGITFESYRRKLLCGTANSKTGCAWEKKKAAGRVLARKRYYRNRAERLVQQRQWYYKNKDKLDRSEYHRKWYAKNREAYLIRTREYRKNNRLIANIAKQRYRSRVANTTGVHTVQEWVKLKEIFDNRCVNCGVKEAPGKTLTEDHKVPISRGGGNGIDNIQPLCQSCNSKKNTKTMFVASSLLTKQTYLCPNLF